MPPDGGRLSHAMSASDGSPRTRCVQLGGLVHHDLGLLDRAARDLVTLLGGREVLEDDHDVRGAVLEVGEVAVGSADVDGVRQLSVERDFGLVGEGAHARRRAVGIGRGELAHHSRRPGLAVVGQHEAHVGADLPGADRGRVERGHTRVAAERAGLAQHVGRATRV